MDWFDKGAILGIVGYSFILGVLVGSVGTILILEY